MKITSLHPLYAARRVQQLLYERSNPADPWLTPQAIELLDDWLKPTDAGLEWGSGRSTRWLARRVGQLTSVEHEQGWFEQVKSDLPRTAGGHTVDYRFVECDLRRSDSPESHPYCDIADELEPGSLDFALVDGVIRLSCFRKAIDRLKPGGLLILDNAERYVPNRRGERYTTFYNHRDDMASPAWADAMTRVEGWRPIHTTNGLWDTRLWVKPA